MSFARPYPSLRTRILENGSKYGTIPSGHASLAKPPQQSFAERYRGTEYETHWTTAPVAEPAVSRGRTMVLVVGAAVTGVLILLLTATPA